MKKLDARQRVERQLDFLLELDRLKTVLRQTWLTDGSRRENDAEHSWHIAVMAIVLAEHSADPGIDLLKVLKMLLIHDVVEIDAGDTFAYDEVGALDKEKRERAAAERIFGMLPDEQSAAFRDLWEEFEARRSPEARFAAGLDRLQPILHNYHTQGKAWLAHGITARQVVARNQHMAEGAPRLWDYARGIIDEAVARGYLAGGGD